jgi:hypothetical protein
MPIIHPKTGEKYYADISKLNRIIIEPRKVIDLIHKTIHRIEFRLEEDRDVIKIVASLSDAYKSCDMPLEEFEQILFDIVTGEKNLRLWDHEKFKKYLSQLSSSLLYDFGQQGKYFVFLNEKEQKKQGIGIIIDNKTKLEIGTFESIELTGRNNKQIELKANQFILSPDDMKDLSSEVTGYLYLYYSIEDQIMYTFTPLNTASFSFTENGFIDDFISIENVNIEIEPFTKDHFRYSLIEEAVKEKKFIDGMDYTNPMNQLYLDEFRQKRFKIIQESREAAKKEKIYNQFSDIDFDF